MAYNNNTSYRSREPQGPRKNHEIRVSEVLLIDETGENVGVVTTQEALVRAHDAELDLVEISPNANPPVCKILDYSKYVYEQRKKAKESKTTTKMKPMKEFKFNAGIDQHDIDFRVRRATEYLNKGHNVRITVWRKGRQTQDFAEDTFAKVREYFGEYETVEDKPKSEGRRMFVTYKSNK